MTRNSRSVRERRCFLRAAGRASVTCLSWPLLVQLASCGADGNEAVETSLRIALEDVPDGGRLDILLGDVPVELRRRGAEVTARSLLCPHQGCEVEWQPEAEEYFCPCHDGRFDQQGRVIAGPPTRPLKRIAVRREAELLIIGP